MKHFIYFLYSANTIVYIGVTNNLKRRLTEHGLNKYDKYRVIECDSRERALHYERRLIKYFKPILNKPVPTEKETVSCRIEESDLLVLIQEAQKKEWTLSYYVQSIINQHVKKNKLVKI